MHRTMWLNLTGSKQNTGKNKESFKERLSHRFLILTGRGSPLFHGTPLGRCLAENKQQTR